jgi:hypothetical protein
VVKVNSKVYRYTSTDWFTKRDELGQVIEVWLWVGNKGQED